MDYEETELEEYSLKPKKEYNYKILFPNGNFFAFCTKRKRERYISKNLCTIIDDKTIQLTFMPKYKDSSLFTYVHSINNQKDICCVCGSCSAQLNCHGIIPPEFLKWFPNKRTVGLYNKVLICNECLDTYNAEQFTFRKQLLSDLTISRDDKLFAIKSLANNLLHKGNNQVVAEKLEKLLGHTPSPEELKELGKLNCLMVGSQKANFNSIGRYIVNKYNEMNKLADFIHLWKNHFCSTMNPQYLPAYLNNLC